MIHIILHDAEFDREWAWETLGSLLRPEMKILILPLGGNSGWSEETVYYQDQIRRKGDAARKLILPFRHYGIPRANISVLEYYEEDMYSLKTKIRNADLVCIAGEDPQTCLHCMEDTALDAVLADYTGILMSIGGAAAPLTETFLSYGTEETGLGLLQGFDLDAQYTEDAEHISSLIRLLENHCRQLLVVPEEGGVLIDESDCALFGEAFISTVNDLEELYTLEESLL